MVGRLLLVAAVVLSPLVLYGLLLLIRSRIQTNRQRQQRIRYSVYEIQARIARDREAANRTDELPEDGHLPPGWNWPQRDKDELIRRTIPPQRMRPYVRQPLSHVRKTND